MTDMTREEKMKIVINNYFKTECSVNTSIREAFEKGFRIGASKVQKKHGKWVEDVAYYAEDGCPCIITRCDQCGEPNPVSKFCPNCGAKMEGNDGND